MVETTVFDAQPRQRLGKGGARTARRAGRTPAVIYGDNKDPLPVSVDQQALGREILKVGFFARVFAVKIDGETHEALARDVQFHPVTDQPIHVDFLRVSETTKLNINIPVIFEGEELSPGLKRGGVLNIVRHEVEVVCAVSNIPDSIIINLDGLEIGDGVHISDIALPTGVLPTITDRDFTIATVAAPTVLTVEEEEEAVEGEEGEEVEGDQEAEGADGEEKDKEEGGGS